MKKGLPIAVALTIAIMIGFAIFLQRNGPAEEVETTAAVQTTTVNFVELPATLEELAAQQNAALAEQNTYTASMYSIQVRAEGDKLVYAFTYMIERSAAELQAALDEMGDSYGSQIAAHKDAGYDISAIVIELLDWNGKQLARKEFQ